MVSSRPQKIILNLVTLSVLVVLFGESQKQSATMIPSILFCTVVESSRCRRISNNPIRNDFQIIIFFIFPKKTWLNKIPQTKKQSPLCKTYGSLAKGLTCSSVHVKTHSTQRRKGHIMGYLKCAKTSYDRYNGLTK